MRAKWSTSLLLILLQAATAGAAPQTAPASRPVDPKQVVGNWLGTLHIGAVELRLGLKLKMADGKLAGTLDSIDQRANDLPIDTVTLDGSKLTFTMVKLLAGYQGQINAADDSISGTWTQAGNQMPLKFARVEQIPTLRRPQEPKKPYPYREEDVSYDSAPDVKLAATLTLPQGKGPFPAVVLITGSGPQDRDEALMGHRPFLVLADHLTRAGIAVLRADDRGVAKSTGSFAGAVNDDFVTDALAGVAYLKSRPEIDKKKIGLVGHSEGGVVAPKAAVKGPDDVAFIVMIAGIGVPADQLLLRQGDDIMRAEGVDEDAIRRISPIRKQMLDLIKSTADRAEAEKGVKELTKQLREALTPGQREQLGKMDAGNEAAMSQLILSPWFRDLMRYDPTAVLAKVKCPVLAINGDRDLQVASKENLPAIKAALEKGGNQDVEIKEFPGLNHLFQHSNVGKVSEYGKIEETFAPEAMETISRWITRHTGR